MNKKKSKETNPKTSKNESTARMHAKQNKAPHVSISKNKNKKLVVD